MHGVRDTMILPNQEEERDVEDTMDGSISWLCNRWFEWDDGLGVVEAGVVHFCRDRVRGHELRWELREERHP